jgi:hypothetical protein
MSSEQKLSPLLWSEKPPADLLPAKSTTRLVIGILKTRDQDPKTWYLDAGEALRDYIKRLPKEVEDMKDGIKLVLLDGMPVLMPNGYYLRLPHRHFKTTVDSKVDSDTSAAWMELDEGTKKTFYDRFEKQYLTAPERVHFWLLPRLSYDHLLEMRAAIPVSRLAFRAPATRTALIATSNDNNDIKISLDQETGMYQLVSHKIPVFYTDLTDGRLALMRYIVDHHPVIRKRKQKERAKAIADATERVFPAEIDDLIASMISAKYRSS